MELTAEKYEQLRKYFFPDCELHSEYLDVMLSRFLSYRSRRREECDIKEFYSVRAFCQELGDRVINYCFSSKYRCIRFSKIEYLKHYEYIDFSEKRFNPIGDPDRHIVTIGNYTFTIENPFDYNFIIILLKWSDEVINNNEFCINRQVDATPIFIDEKVHQLYHLDIDVNSSDPFIIGDGEYQYFEFYNIPDLDKQGKGLLCFYISEDRVPLNIENKSISQIYHTFNLEKNDVSPQFCVLYNAIIKIIQRRGEISYDKKRISNDFLCDLRDFPIYSKELLVYGNEEKLVLYVFFDETLIKGVMFKVHSLKEYFFLAAWLIVAIAYHISAERFVDKNELIEKYWPTFPGVEEWHKVQDIINKYRK